MRIAFDELTLKDIIKRDFPFFRKVSSYFLFFVPRLKSDRLNCLIVCRLPQQSASWKVESCMLERRKACETFPVLERKGDHSFQRMVESRMLYVRA